MRSTVYVCHDCGHRSVGRTLDAAVDARDHQYLEHMRETAWRDHVTGLAELAVAIQPSMFD
jgi:hypothetical protein